MGTPLDMEGTLNFNCYTLQIRNYLKTYINSMSICKSLGKYLFRHVKGKSMVNFYICNTLDQNSENSESCLISRSRHRTTNNQFSEFRISNIYNKIFVLIFLMILRTHFETSLRFRKN